MHTRSQGGYRIGQTVSYRGERVVIKGFPNRFTALVAPVQLLRARWIAKTVAMADITR